MRINPLAGSQHGMSRVCGATVAGLGCEEIQQAGLHRKRQGGGTDAQAQPFQDAATILIDGFRRDILFGGVMRSTALDQHENPGTMRLTTIRPAPAEFYFTQNYMSWLRGSALAMVPARKSTTNTSRGTTITFGTIRLTP